MIIKKIVPFFLAMALSGAVMAGFSLTAQSQSVKTVNVLNYGANGNDRKDDTLAIQKALNTALSSDVPVKVVVPKGNYYVGAPEGLSARSLKIFSNTTLELEEGAMILRSYDSPNVYLFSTSGYSNITIRGGTLSANVQLTNRARGIMSLRDVTGLTIEDVDFISFCGTHAVLLDGAEDLTVRRCSFKGFRPFSGTADEYRAQTNSTSYWSSEALHIDFDVDNNRTIKNVSVSECTFEGCPSGVGTHHVYDGFTGENIKIFNNTFIGCYYSACNATNFKSFDFYGNTAFNTPTLIHSENVRGSIRDNYVDNSSYAPSDYTLGLIYRFGVNYLDLNTLAPITVSNNKDKTTQQINMTNSASVEVSGNVIKVNDYMAAADPRECGIRVYQRAAANVHDNLIMNAPYRAISADDASVSISGNTIMNCGGGVYLSACRNAVVSQNRTAGLLARGVSADSCSSIMIKDNVIGQSGSEGVYLNGCGESCVIEDNAVTDSGSDGIYAQNSQIRMIKGNMISGSQGDAVCIGNSLVKEITANSFCANIGFDLTADENARAELFSANTSDKGELNLIADDAIAELSESELHSHSFRNEKTAAPTCKSAGYTIYRCQSCGLRYEGSLTEPLAHSFNTNIIKPTYFSVGYSMNVCRICGSSYTCSYTQALSLPDVSGMRAAATSANAVKLTWDRVDGAQGYCVYVYNKSLKKWEHYKNTTGNVMLINKLNSGEAYAFTVRAFIKVNGRTVLSPNFENFKTSTKPAAVSFAVKSEKAGEASLSWSKVTGATSYAVYYKTATSKWVKLATLNNKTTSFTKSGLRQGGQYYFTVRAYRTYEGVTYGGNFIAKGVKPITAAQQKALEKARAAAEKTAKK